MALGASAMRTRAETPDTYSLVIVVPPKKKDPDSAANALRGSLDPVTLPTTSRIITPH
jgi:hypothetical protein